jgi:hypothetical protein
MSEGIEALGSDPAEQKLLIGKAELLIQPQGCGQLIAVIKKRIHNGWTAVIRKDRSAIGENVRKMLYMASNAGIGKASGVMGFSAVDTVPVFQSSECIGAEPGYGIRFAI